MTLNSPPTNYISWRAQNKSILVGYGLFLFHVGIDVNSLISVASTSVAYYSDTLLKNQILKQISGRPLQIWIDYDEEEVRVNIPIIIAPLERSFSQGKQAQSLDYSKLLKVGDKKKLNLGSIVLLVMLLLFDFYIHLGCARQLGESKRIETTKTFIIKTPL